MINSDFEKINMEYPKYLYYLLYIINMKSNIIHSHMAHVKQNKTNYKITLALPTIHCM